MTTMKKMLVSFVAGAVLGILYAPAKGVKTRRKLSGIGNDLKSGWNTITDNLADHIDTFRTGVDNVADNAIDKVESTQFSVGDKGGFL